MRAYLLNCSRLLVKTHKTKTFKLTIKPYSVYRKNSLVNTQVTLFKQGKDSLLLSLRDLLKASRGNLILCCPHKIVKNEGP